MIQPRHKLRRTQQRRQQMANQPRTQIRKKGMVRKKRKKWVTLREFGDLLGVMIPLAIKVLILLVVLLGIGIVANAVGPAFHLIHAGFLANEMVERFWV